MADYLEPWIKINNPNSIGAPDYIASYKYFESKIGE